MTLYELEFVRKVLRTCMMSFQGDEKALEIIEKEIKLKTMDPRKDDDKNDTKTI